MAELNANENLNPDEQLMARSILNQGNGKNSQPDTRENQVAQNRPEILEDEEAQKSAKIALKNEQKKSEQGAPAQNAIQTVIGFSPAIWYAAIILAAGYDLYNLVGLETGSWLDWITDILLGGGLGALLWTQGAKKNQTKRIIIWLSTTVAEIIPFVGLLPLWTLAVMYQFHSAWRDNEANLIEKEQAAKT
ncbi:MAG: hypothetical protein PHC97_04620 [Patescibacteria group bacterium]|nr:hypothetical protein [Patescibacteria group bacterium]